MEPACLICLTWSQVLWDFTGIVRLCSEGRRHFYTKSIISTAVMRILKSVIVNYVLLRPTFIENYPPPDTLSEMWLTPIVSGLTLLLMMNFNCFFFLSRHCVFPPPLLLASSSCSLTECCHSNSCKTSVTNQSVLWIIKNCPSIIKDYCVWSLTVQTLSMMGVSHTVTKCWKVWFR